MELRTDSIENPKNLQKTGYFSGFYEVVTATCKGISNTSCKIYRALSEKIWRPKQDSEQFMKELAKKSVVVLNDKGELVEFCGSTEQKMKILSCRALETRHSEEEAVKIAKELQKNLMKAVEDNKGTIEKVKDSVSSNGKKVIRFMYGQKDHLKTAVNYGVEMTSIIYFGDIVSFAIPKLYNQLTDIFELTIEGVTVQVGIPRYLSSIFSRPASKALAGAALSPVFSAILGLTKQVAKDATSKCIDLVFQSMNVFDPELKKTTYCRYVKDGCEKEILPILNEGFTKITVLKDEENENGVEVEISRSFGFGPERGRIHYPLGNMMLPEQPDLEMDLVKEMEEENREKIHFAVENIFKQVEARQKIEEAGCDPEEWDVV